MTPDPEKVREIAREYLADRISEPSDVGAYVMGFVGYNLTKHEYGAWCSAVRAELLAAVPSWPNEQARNERAEAAERERNEWRGYASRAKESCDEWSWRALKAEAELASTQAERDADVRAVARLLRDFRHNYPGLTSLKAMTRLEERFADRIAELREREGGEKP